ncbi:MAG: hypothetical protein UU64_C0002G0107 [candidate division WWE3 bacterium GW2011_GWF2_41_45]|uniref:Uncharacterized protein n=1 Tax=candidate division WWE3 bacterium GW2011_GWC2_41_23 TaxID=1619123 RepID=A0A0G0VRL4_UNCKA|nr:MAG: hypothetical protein UU55_C0001G0011 [candidate division WWE3 bacterium GW2011_GWC2_41_23]KKS10705.1 MAG: hypothetical protein UU64_C0002G0107 [candidate division WWE3 bacterium GW2011_GWF2_41_45]KKS12284.1 MAG: hypothetical protein UU68_C0002G0010 [candidate division WWE3 bacterium GW2011_GWF1_41_53]KKS20357.1 MAG: hypothetical protein UU79_C0001G0011 [candidate division WWE3 bacterium GW2011_GWE1_41_72]KKS28185.1 MAG: hypothetical protein UU86_C0009G0015 [candidate division WWE3 bacte
MELRYTSYVSISTLLNEFDQIGLNIGEYVITGSGPLAVRNLREPHDIDILVLPEIWNKYKNMYPVRSERFETIQIGNITLLGFGSHFANPKICAVENQIKNADIIDGHSYVNLLTLRGFKKALGREKDLADIQLMDQFLKVKSSN